MNGNRIESFNCFPFTLSFVEGWTGFWQFAANAKVAVEFIRIMR